MKKTVIQEIFYVLSAAIAVFFTMEAFWPRLVLAYLNLNILLLLWFINVILLLFINKKNN